METFIIDSKLLVCPITTVLSVNALLVWWLFMLANKVIVRLKVAHLRTVGS